MFVRVIRRTEDEGEVDSLFECERVRLYQTSRGGNNHHPNVMVAMEQPDINLEIEKASSEVYLMNSDGKTIDSYRWA